MAPAEWEEVRNLDTAAAQPWTRENLVRCDPYLVWADAVTGRPGSPTLTGSTQEVDEVAVAVLVELTPTGDYSRFRNWLNPDPDDADSLKFVPNGFEPAAGTQFVTGQVNRAGLAMLVNGVVNGHIERFQLQESRLDMARACGNGWQTCQKPQPQPQPQPEPDDKVAAEPSMLEAQRGTYLGIIDDGLPALRVAQAVRHTGLPAHVWDQGWQPPESVPCDAGPPEGTDPHWDVPWTADAAGTGSTTPAVRGFLYGRRLKPVPETGMVGPAGGKEHRYFHPPPRQSHGAAVLGLLAPWLSDARGPVKAPPHISGLAMVQLPTRTVVDTSGGSLAMRVLDGLRHVLWQEEADRSGQESPRPVVANVSYGVHAGPHDGTSMVERALLEMLDAHPHLHLVLPAGNAARAGCHAQRTLSAKGESADAGVFMLQVLPDNGRDSFVEIWLPPGAAVAIEIRPPGSERVFSISEGEARIHFEPEPGDPKLPRRVHFGAVYPDSVAQGTQGTMALVAIGSTRRARQDQAIHGCAHQRRRLDVAGYSGLWALKVCNLTEGAITVDAWVERGDAAPDASGGSRQAYFPDSCHEAVRLGNSTPEGTLNGIATMTHERLHVVGAMRADGALADYSAAGPARAPATRVGPDVVVAADASRNMPGIRTMGFGPGVIDRINGTSAACALFARELARQLSDPAWTAPARPGDPPPEMACVTDSQPEAPPGARGQAERRAHPHEVPL
jgi:hypothetical protein